MANDNTHAPAVAALNAAPLGVSSVQPQPERMILWSAPGVEISPLKDALETRFTLTTQARLSEIDTARGESTPVLLLFAAAEAHVLATLAQDSNSEDAMSRAVAVWCDKAEALLKLNRTNRRRVHLLEVDMVGRHPQAFLAHFSLPKSDESVAALRSMYHPPDDPVLALLAHHSLASTPRACELRDELIAAAYDFSAAGADPVRVQNDVGAAFSAYRKTLEESDQNTQIRSQNALIQDKVDSLESKLSQLEKQAEELRHTNNHLRDELDGFTTVEIQLRQRLEQTSQGLESSQGELAGIYQQAELLKAQNRLMQEELEILQKSNHSLAARADDGTRLAARISEKEQALVAVGARLNTLENRISVMARAAEHQSTKAVDQKAALDLELRQSRDQAAALECELQRITLSKSFRLTAPFRRLRRMLSGRE